MLLASFLASCVNPQSIFVHNEDVSIRDKTWPELKSRYLVRFEGGRIKVGRNYLNYEPFALALRDSKSIVTVINVEGGGKVLLSLNCDQDFLVLSVDGSVYKVPVSLIEDNGSTRVNTISNENNVLFENINLYIKRDPSI